MALTALGALGPAAQEELLREVQEEIQWTPAEELERTFDLAQELFEEDPVYGRLLRSRVAFALLFDPDGVPREGLDRARSREWALAGIEDLAWLLGEEQEPAQDPGWMLALFGSHLYNTGLGLDARVEAGLRTIFELALPTQVPFATVLLVEYLQAHHGDDPCLPVLADAERRTADLRADGSLEVLVIDNLRARVHRRQGKPEDALEIASTALERFEALDVKQQVVYAAELVGARETVADCLLDLSLEADVLEGNRKLLARDQLFLDESQRETLSVQIAMALIESDGSIGGSEGESAAILTGIAERSASAVNRHLALSVLGLLALADGQPTRATEYARRAERLEVEESYRPPTRMLAFRQAVGLRGCRLDAESIPEGDPEAPQRWLDGLATSVDGLIEEWTTEQRDVGGEGDLLDLRTRFAVLELLLQRCLLESPEAGLLTLARLQSSSRLARELGADAVTAESLQRAFARPEQGALAFFFGRTSALVFRVEAGRVEVELAPTRSTLFDRAREYASLLRRSPRRAGPERAERLGELGRELADTLFPPGARAALGRWEHLLLIGTDVLAGGTVSALPVLSERPLCLDTALTLAPSVPVAVAQRVAPGFAPEPDGSSVLVCNALHGERALEEFPHLRPIQLSDTERDALLQPLAPHVALLEGARATWSGALDAARGAALLVLFTHGIADAELPIPAGFLLSPDDESSGAHWWTDVRAAPVPPWIVLATCGSGVGKRRLGDEAASDLRGAFLLAGARGIVHTYGNVDQAATHALLAGLHRGLAEGRSLDDALRRARLDVWEREGFADPYFTGLVQVFGVGDEAPLAARSGAHEANRATPIGIGVALGLMGALLLVVSRRRATRA